MFRFWKRRPRTVVLGQQLADARKVEEQRLASEPALASPMPKSGYPDDDRGYLEFLDPRPLALDAELADLCRRSATLDPAAHAQMRRSIGMDEFYTLLAFSRRMALFAIRDRSAAALRDGFSAVALIEPDRVDPRDIPCALAPLCHAAQRIGESAKELLTAASRNADPDVAHLMLDWARRSLSEKDLRDRSLLWEINSKYGPGFVGTGFRPYSPTIDLVSVAIEIAELLAADQYRVAGLHIAEELPAFWLRSAGEKNVERALRGVLGGVNVSGSLRPGAHPTGESQSVLAWVIELPDAARAQALESLSKSVRDANHAVVGCAEGPLFCLVVGHSFMHAVAAIETNASLERFRAGIHEALRHR
jgi:hypothetical protein